MNWLTKRWRRCFWRFVLFLVAVTAVYCINPSNVELFLRTWFHREIIIFDLVRQKNGFPLLYGEVQVREPKEKSINTKIHVRLDWSCLPVDTFLWPTIKIILRPMWTGFLLIWPLFKLSIFPFFSPFPFWLRTKQWLFKRVRKETHLRKAINPQICRP